MSSWFFPITRLCNACTKNDLATVKQLATEANVNTKGFLGWTPLHNAAAAGNSEIAQYLLVNLKAEVDIRDSENHTPLMLAAGNSGETEDRVLTVKYLLAHKANTNAVDEGLYPPLQLAVLNDNRRIVELLLDSGAKINHQNLDRFTALHAAAGAGNAYLVQRLLAKGADRNIKDGRGKTPADHARDAGFDFDQLQTQSTSPSPSTYSPPSLAVPSVDPMKPTSDSLPKADILKQEIAKELSDLESGH